MMFEDAKRTGAKPEDSARAENADPSFPTSPFPRLMRGTHEPPFYDDDQTVTADSKFKDMLRRATRGVHFGGGLVARQRQG